MANGQLGVRSPVRKGRKLMPLHPGASALASASISSRSSRKASRTSFVALVQFIVHTRGRNRPVASQNGATAPDGSNMGLPKQPKSVPLVPRLMTQSPACMHHK